MGINNPRESDVTAYIARHPELTGPGKISWNRSLKQWIARNTPLTWNEASVFQSAYRPYAKQWAYFDPHTNDMIYQLPTMFPSLDHKNIGIAVCTHDQIPFVALMTGSLPSLDYLGRAGQFFSRWTYEKVEAEEGQLDVGGADADEWGYRRVDNITDEVLAHYRSNVDPQTTKDDIFYYVYGILHDPSYREEFAADLKNNVAPHSDSRIGRPFPSRSRNRS